jgi:S-adenosylmethionine synthetase
MVAVTLVEKVPDRHVGVTRATREQAPQAAATAAVVFGVALRRRTARAWPVAVALQRPVMTVSPHRREQAVHVLVA